MIDLTRPRLVTLAGAGSLGLLLGAWFFEFVVGLAPCAMCYWQRWPHIAAVVIAVLCMAPLPRGPAIALGLGGAVAAATSSGIGVYHSGVERGWWLGPASCTSRGQDLGTLSGESLLDPLAASAVVMCDEIPWTLAGLSMANWNVVASAVIAAIWLVSVSAVERRHQTA
ncbi:MAG: disulfide bond formation protein B [Pseudomonadota bacterium]